MCAAAGPILTIVWLCGFLMTGFIPALDPAWSAQQVSQFYIDNLMSIRAGIVIMMIALAFYSPFYSAIAIQLCRMKNPSPVMIFWFTLASAAFLCYLFYCYEIWAAATYRPENTTAVQMYNDLTWISYLWPVTFAPATYFPIAFSILADRRNTEIFPRWYAFYNLWSALLALSGTFVIFFKGGPFAVNGLFAYWVNLTVFFIWYPITSVVLIKSVNRATARTDDSRVAMSSASAVLGAGNPQ